MDEYNQHRFDRSLLPIITLHGLALLFLISDGGLKSQDVAKTWRPVLLSLLSCLVLKWLPDKRRARQGANYFLLFLHAHGWATNPTQVSDFGIVLQGASDDGGAGSAASHQRQTAAVDYTSGPVLACSATMFAFFWGAHLMLLQHIGLSLRFRVGIIGLIGGSGALQLGMGTELVFFLVPFALMTAMSELFEYQLLLALGLSIRTSKREKQLEQDLTAMVAHETRNPLNGVVGNLLEAQAALDRASGKDLKETTNLLEVQAALSRASKGEASKGRASNEVVSRSAPKATADDKEGRTDVSAARDHVADAIVCSRMTLRVLSNLNSLSRLDAGLFNPELVPVVLSELLADVVAVLRTQLREGVQLKVGIDGSVPHAVLSDRKILGQILTNLGQNAARHTTQGFVEVRISVAGEAVGPTSGRVGSSSPKQIDPKTTEGGTTVGDYPSDGRRALTFAVRDTGSGLSPQRAKSLFGRYASSDGVGLGLHLSQQQAAKLGSRIEFASPWPHGWQAPAPSRGVAGSGDAEGGDAGPGTSFSFSLLLDLVQDTSSFDEGAKQQRPQRSLVRFGGHARILVADDVVMNVRLLSLMIRRHCCATYDVHTATTTDEVLSQTRSTRFDLIIIDEIFSENPQAPKGSNIIRQLRATEKMAASAAAANATASPDVVNAAAGSQEQAADRPLVIVSCTGNEAYERAALVAAGADAVWSKPTPNAHDGTLQRELAALLPWLVLEEDEA